MAKILKFYNYDAALTHYKGQIRHIRQAYTRSNKLKIVAKPVLLLAVMKAIDEGTITANHFSYDELEPRYNELFSKYFIRARQESRTPMHYPWYFMHHDGFWHLSWEGKESFETETPSAAMLHRNSSHAYFDDDLWTLVCNPDYRHQLMHFIIDEKIIAPLSASQQDMAAEGGPSLKSLLLMLIAM